MYVVSQHGKLQKGKVLRVQQFGRLTDSNAGMQSNSGNKKRLDSNRSVTWSRWIWESHTVTRRASFSARTSRESGRNVHKGKYR